MTHYSIPDDIQCCLRDILDYLLQEEKHGFYEDPCSNHIYIRALTVSTWLENIQNDTHTLQPEVNISESQ